MKKAKRIAALAGVIALSLGLPAFFWSVRRTPVGFGFRIPSVFAQAIFQQRCQTPTIPITGIGWQSSNLTNDQLLQWGCLDKIGNLQIATIVYVGTPDVNSDLGASMIVADSDLGAGTGELDVIAGTSTWTTSVTFSGPRKIRFVKGGIYTIATGALNTPSAVLIDCGGRQNAILTFTGSGVALKFNWGNAGGSYPDWSYGIRDCQILGPGGINGSGNSGTGIQIGDSTHAAIGASIENDLVAGFTTGLTFGNINSWGTRILHSTFANSTQNFLWNVTSASGMENTDIIHTVFTNTNSMNANDFQITGTGVLELNCIDCSFDGSQINLGGSSQNVIRFVGKHQEVTSNSNVVPMLVSAGTVLDESPAFQWDGSTTSSVSGVNVSAGSYTIRNATWKAQAGAPVTNNIVQSGTGNVFTLNPLMLASNVGGLSSGGSGILWNCDAVFAFCNFPGQIGASSFVGTPSVTFATLGTPTNGTIKFCSDCNATCAAGASTGRFCARENGAWVGF